VPLHIRSRVHALMRLDREIRIGGAEGEDVLPLLCFRNGGGLAVTVSVVPFRLACLNGMLLPIAGAQRTWKARHTANVEAKLTDARRTLGIAWRHYDELEELGGRLLRERLTEGTSSASSPASCRSPTRGPTRRTAGGQCATRSRRARRSARRIGRPPDLDAIRGTRRTAARAHAEARFDRATEPQPLKDSAGSTDGRREQVMTSTLTTVPLAKIKPREGFNPRSEFADEQIAAA
jgi:Domain of unknown function (DUF932)